MREGSGIDMLYRDNVRSEIESGEVQVIRVAGLDMRVASPESPRCAKRGLAHVLALAPLSLFGLTKPIVDAAKPLFSENSKRKDARPARRRRACAWRRSRAPR